MLKQNLRRRSSDIWLKIPLDTFYLGLIRKVIGDIAVKVGFSPEEVSKMEMAVDEACSAVIKQTSPDIAKIRRVDTEKHISLQVNISKGSIAVILEFLGPPINFHQKQKVNPEELLNKLDLSNLAVYIIRTFMDKVHYNQSNGKNKLQMIKKFKPPAKSS